MKTTMEIPKEFEADYNKDRFYEYFSRVLVDIKDGCLCGTYEEETTKMFIESFENAKEEKYDIKEFVEYIIYYMYIFIFIILQSQWIGLKTPWCHTLWLPDLFSMMHNPML